MTHILHYYNMNFELVRPSYAHYPDIYQLAY